MLFYVQLRESQHLGNGTSDHRNENPKTLFNTNYPPKPGENQLSIINDLYLNLFS